MTRLHVWRLEHIGCKSKTGAKHWHGPASGFCDQSMYGFGWNGPTPQDEGVHIRPRQVCGVLEHQVHAWWSTPAQDATRRLPKGWQFSLYSVPESAAHVTKTQVVFDIKKARQLKTARRTGKSFIRKAASR